MSHSKSKVYEICWFVAFQPDKLMNLLWECTWQLVQKRNWRFPPFILTCLLLTRHALLLILKARCESAGLSWQSFRNKQAHLAHLARRCSREVWIAVKTDCHKLRSSIETKGLNEPPLATMWTSVESNTSLRVSRFQKSIQCRGHCEFLPLRRAGICFRMFFVVGCFLYFVCFSFLLRGSRCVSFL